LTSLSKGCYNTFFSHIYIEKEILHHKNTQKIAARFPRAEIVEISHYKDIFCRKGQNFFIQKKSPCLILAKKNNSMVYEGAPVCQSFGNQHFYYTSSVMNCIYDCEYCYLQGMYPCAHLVVFVNLEDIFLEVEKLLKQHPVYLCISYDTDLLALDSVLLYVKEWMGFCRKHKELTIELRTKSSNWSALSNMYNSDSKNTPPQNFILAWTLSPNEFIKEYERHTPSLEERIRCVKNAISAGYKVRLCFDPLLYHKDWKSIYEEFIRTVFKQVNGAKLFDVSLGVFRISQEFLKQMRKQRMDSVILQYPYENDKGVYHYNKSLTHEIITFTECLLAEYVPKDRIFIWKEATS